ncbi:basic salivary proline-rich protein 1-like [Dryobates pubescens]|uniref:basic salivary proline-rich protein 1-like n=1 Tax=Dryobates pubescens TaxID=118200 RepID=UPI0023BA1DFF|nr:basic salivary proline-rich protein 1-like [Dryobates pubescens]
MTHGPVTSRESAARGPSHTKSGGGGKRGHQPRPLQPPPPPSRGSRAPAHSRGKSRCSPLVGRVAGGVPLSGSPRRGAPPRWVGEERGRWSGGRTSESAGEREARGQPLLPAARGPPPQPPPLSLASPPPPHASPGRGLLGTGGSLFVAWNVAMARGAPASTASICGARWGGRRRRRRGESGTVTPPSPPASPYPLPLPASPRAGHIDPPGQGSDRKHQPRPPPPRARGSDRGSGPGRRVRGARGVLTAASAPPGRGLAAAPRSHVADAAAAAPPRGAVEVQGAEGEPRRCGSVRAVRELRSPTAGTVFPLIPRGTGSAPTLRRGAARWLLGTPWGSVGPQQGWRRASAWYKCWQ